jgi:Rieske Fe-S protein
MERRQFIRDGCKLCMGIAGVSILSGIFTGCTPLPIYTTEYRDKKVIVPITQFEKTNYVIARCNNLHFDIAILKETDGTYKSFIMQCTHADNPVEFNGNEFTCSLHGSVFTETGAVRKGPAERPLVSLKTELVDGNLVIYN